METIRPEWLWWLMVRIREEDPEDSRGLWERFEAASGEEGGDVSACALFGEKEGEGAMAAARAAGGPGGGEKRGWTDAPGPFCPGSPRRRPPRRRGLPGREAAPQTRGAEQPPTR